MMLWGAGWWTALGFLTRIPVPSRLLARTSDLGVALPWFPAVGLLLGACLVLADTLLRFVLPPAPASTLLVLLWLGLTGGLHVDGLMDTADAVFAPATPERRLEIMHDLNAGSFGVAAVVALLLLKIAAVQALAGTPGLLGPALLLAPIMGRWAIVSAITLFPYARQEGLGAPLKAAASPRLLLIASVIPALLVAVSGSAVIAACLIGALGAWVMARLLLRALPGLTGDCYGAICEVVEAGVLLAVGSFTYTAAR